uniref:Putative flavonol glucosyltransferase n=1 Tax=Sorghum bicolor TaxID=4558 RepID=Q5NKS3_SORBI|nr:putative flavonol glucosyltransferase [Sorghum bicolor]AAQ06264.1 putative flavonol glucosyltransferase [Sorghum bicolor]
MEKKTVVLYPGVGVGHLAPMLELAKAFLRHGGDQVDVAIAVFEPPVYANGFASTVARAKASNASVALHVLPPPPPPPAASDDAEPDAIVLDMFCADALDVAAELGLPAYFFFPSGTAGLACFLGLPAMRARVGTSFAALGNSAVLSFPGAPPFTVADLAQGLADDGEACKGIIGVAARMPEARGILINSFESLEPRAMWALRDGLCVPDRPTPPVYCVGPRMGQEVRRAPLEIKVCPVTYHRHHRSRGTDIDIHCGREAPPGARVPAAGRPHGEHRCRRRGTGGKRTGEVAL